MLRAPTLCLALLGLLLGMTGTAQARNSFYNDWVTAYPSSTSDDKVISGTGNNCSLCHSAINGGDGWNEYGWALRVEVVGGATQAQALVNIEPVDSDLDPSASSNLLEIILDAQPGWTVGPVNTLYFKNGSTVPSQLAPAGIPDLDPPALLENVPTLGLAGGALLGLGLLGVAARRRRSQDARF